LAPFVDGDYIMTDAVTFDRVALRLGDSRVLANCTFAVHEGELVGVLRPNGAGKTTLMRAVLGLLPPSGGQVRVLGHAPRRGNAAIGYLPQVRTVLPDLSVRGLDFIASSVNGAKWGLPSLKRAERRLVEKTLDLIGAASSVFGRCLRCQEANDSGCCWRRR
jgi:zinc/manganese transport system ATP-binding protein